MSRWPTRKLGINDQWIYFIRMISLTRWCILGSKFVTFYCTKFRKSLCYNVVVGKLGSNRHFKKKNCKLVETSLPTQGEITQLRIVTQYQLSRASKPIRDIPVYWLVNDGILIVACYNPQLGGIDMYKWYSLSSISNQGSDHCSSSLIDW